MRYTPQGVISFLTSYTPAGGEGARIAPATYAEDTKKGHPPGPAVSPSTPIRTLDDEGNIVLSNHAPSVVVDSQASQTTRAESALWDLRDELNLPGIVVREGDESVLFEALKKKMKGEDGFDIERMTDILRARLKVSDDQISSWTLPHRHVDGIVRLASVEEDGVKEVWKSHDMTGLYGRIIDASPHSLENILHLSPNSLLHGFWLSSGAPIRHRVARHYSYDIHAYGASQVQYGATKLSEFPTSSNLQYKRNNEGVLRETTAKGKKPSELLLGSVPSYSNAHVTAESIIGSGSLLSGSLWANLGKDKRVSEEQREAAFDALMSLAMLGNALAAQEWDLRSGCTLIPEKVFVVETTPQSKKVLEVPSVDELIDNAAIDITRAQSLGIFGSKEDREVVYLSKSLAEITTGAFVRELLKEDASEEE